MSSGALLPDNGELGVGLAETGRDMQTVILQLYGILIQIQIRVKDLHLRL